MLARSMSRTVLRLTVCALLVNQTRAALPLPLQEQSFVLDKPADTFLDMRGWSRGIVFVNGVNLGRYWNVGPQQTLYLPGYGCAAARTESSYSIPTARTVRPYGDCAHRYSTSFATPPELGERERIVFPAMDQCSSYLCVKQA